MSIHFSASLTEKTPNFKILQSMLYDLRPYNLKELHNSGPIAYTLKLSKRPLISSYIASKLSKNKFLLNYTLLYNSEAARFRTVL